MTDEPPQTPNRRLPRPRRRESPAPLTAPLSGQVLPPAQQPAPEYYDDYDDYAPEHEPLLRNPYVLAALAVGGAIIMAIVVVVLAGGGGGGGGSAGFSTPNPLTPDAGVSIEVITTSRVREGPSTEYQEVGTLPRGQRVQVTGRNTESTWFQIVFPQNSTLRGWVAASALKVADLNPASLAVVAITPISRPTIVQPTLAPEPTETPGATATVEATAAPGPDIAVGIANSNCTPGAPLVVVVTNAGQSPITNRTLTLTVLVGNTAIATSSIPLSSLGPSDAVTIPTNETVRSPRTTVTADLQGSPADINRANNTIECVSSGLTPTPGGTAPAATPTPTASP